MMWRRYLVIAFFGTGVLLLQVSWRGQNWIFDRDSTTLNDVGIEMVPSFVRLDDLQMGELRTGEVTIRNRTATAIELDEPSSSCGCVIVKLDKTTIPPAGEALLQFRVKSGNAPASLSQRISLKTTSLPMMSAQLQIEGEVKARFWSDPPELSFEVDPAGPQTIIARIYRQESKFLAVYESSSTECDIENVERHGDFDLLRIQINADRPGSASLAVFNRDSANRKVPIWEVPVQWRIRPSLIYVPRFVDVPKANSDELQSGASIFVYTDFNVNDVAVKYRARVPWCKVTGASALNSHCFEIRLKVDRSNVVDGFVKDVPILSIWKADEPESRYNLFGVMK